MNMTPGKVGEPYVTTSAPVARMLAGVWSSGSTDMPPVTATMSAPRARKSSMARRVVSGSSPTRVWPMTSEPRNLNFRRSTGPNLSSIRPW
jgi:hypothetical protein